MTQKFWSQAVQDHENMISALEQRDSKRLGQILRDHLCNKLEFPEDGVSDPERTTPVLVKPGAAVFFDRRLWHSGGRNFSEATRKVLFYGYSYRWLRPRDDMTVEHFMDRCDPIRRQLLGASASGHGYTSPSDEDVPLRDWIREHQGEEAVVA